MALRLRVRALRWRESLFEDGEALAHLRFKLLTIGRELHGVAGTAKEGDAETLFKLSDAVADRAVGQAKLFGGFRIRLQTRGRLKGAERLQRRQSHGSRTPSRM